MNIQFNTKCVCEAENAVNCRRPRFHSPVTHVMHCGACGSKTFMRVNKPMGKNGTNVRVDILKVYASELLLEALKAVEAEKAEATANPEPVFVGGVEP